MINFRRLALVSGIAVLSAVAVTPKAQAQSTNVDFSGNVPAVCTINSTTPGVLGVFDSRNLLATVSPVLGTPGNINVTCTNGTTFTINSIADNGSTLASGSYAGSIDNTTIRIMDGTTPVLRSDVSPNGSAIGTPNFVPINTVSSLQSGPITNKDYKVELYVGNFGGSPVLPDGSYKVRARVTLTPQ